MAQFLSLLSAAGEGGFEGRGVLTGGCSLSRIQLVIAPIKHSTAAIKLPYS
jgi:hypothetical protein